MTSKAKWNWRHNQAIGSLSMAIGCLNSIMQCPSVERQARKEAQVIRDRIYQLREVVRSNRVNQDGTISSPRRNDINWRKKDDS